MRIEKNLRARKDNNSIDNEKENTAHEFKYDQDNGTSRKRQQREKSDESEEGSPQKLQRVVKSCPIAGDKVLLDVAKEVSDKWNEVGISLGIGFKTLQSMIGSLGMGVPDHRKAFMMLQEWKSRAADGYTHQNLAYALEENGLNSCALKYCYTFKSKIVIGD